MEGEEERWPRSTPCEVVKAGIVCAYNGKGVMIKSVENENGNNRGIGSQKYIKSHAQSKCVIFWKRCHVYSNSR